ncbi:hypothetical protein GA0070624_4169 [Micromonospora rhizosphaerae]|uniref:Uncharacterized protein n=1 Tax=Micromonospora rhizosphaerae TaxID=568872 RepID=A0A1C6SNH6_9ACTN|nr:hypothetical protein [Micromonospora rhizosphaerae]SCL30923.1 hypothetical protein GA0070624_4169 [Micromonospora rhizosphaerae]
MSAEELERRYRRLLAVYPWEHRRTYEEEMLAVLLADTRPGQRRPGLGDALNLIGAGLRARLRVSARGFTEPAWADAAAVTGVLVALVLLTIAGKGLIDQLVPDPSVPPPLRPAGPDLVDWLRVAGWAGVCFAALVGLRSVAAGLAWAAAAAWMVLVGPGVADQPTYVVYTLPQLALAVVAAAALSVPAPPRRAIAVLGARRLATLVLASLAVVTILEVNRLTAPSYDATGYTSYVFYDLEARRSLVVRLYVAGLAAAAVAVVVTLCTLTPQVRRRIPVMLAPVAALAAVIDTALAGWQESSMYLGRVIPLVPAQWAMLVLVPAVTFLAGVLLVRRREETLRMVALGRDADRERPAS